MIGSPLSLESPAVTSLLVVAVFAAWLALVLVMELVKQRDAWQARSQHWFEVAMGSTPMVSEDGAAKLMRDLFPRPMGAAPSTERDVARQRAWRERRATTGRDHLMHHSVDAATDSEAATEIMVFCVGGWEIDR